NAVGAYESYTIDVHTGVSETLTQLWMDDIDGDDTFEIIGYTLGGNTLQQNLFLYRFDNSAYKEIPYEPQCLMMSVGEFKELRDLNGDGLKDLVMTAEQ